MSSLEERYKVLKARAVRNEETGTALAMIFFIMATIALIVGVSSFAALGNLFYMAARLDSDIVFTSQTVGMVYQSVILSSIITVVLCGVSIFALQAVEKRMSAVDKKRLSKL